MQVLQEVPNGSTPPPSSKGVKNGHSPWSAPRERKRRTKPALNDVLGSIEELECTTSPPKRHNGGSSPAARELELAGKGPPAFHGLEAQDVVAAAAAGPLAQGLVAPPAAADPAGASSFSPLANGLRAPSFTAAAGDSGLQLPWQATAADKQRKQLRHAAAYRLAANRRAEAGTAAAAAAGSESQQQPAAFCSQQWQSAASRQEQPFSRLRYEAAPLTEPLAAAASAPLPAAPSAAAAVHPTAHQHLSQQQQQHLLQLLADPLALAHPAGHQQQQQHPLQGGLCVARCSTGQDMETDVHCSWDSERSADISGWQSMQAQLCAEAGAATGPGAEAARPACPPPAMHPGHHSYARLASLPDEKACSSSGYPCAMLCASADAEVDPGDASLRSSLEGPSCSDRQASMLPLRGHARTQQWHSHMASPPGDGASADPLLGPHLGQGSSGIARQRTSRGGNTKWSSCFSCASPFSCRQAPGGGDSDDEVVRRTDSTEGFVIRRQPSSPQRESPHAAREECDGTAGGGTAGRLKRASLNQPPESEDSDLVHRQGAFSARCASTPGGDPYSPCSEGLSDDSFSLASGPGGLRSVSLSVGLRDASIEELTGGLAGGSEGAPTPTVDALNDMLKALSLRPTTHPKDAEELVAEACQTHSIQPNATTARTLEKMWAVHEQLYG